MLSIWPHQHFTDAPVHPPVGGRRPRTRTVREEREAWLTLGIPEQLARGRDEEIHAGVRIPMGVPNTSHNERFAAAVKTYGFSGMLLGRSSRRDQTSGLGRGDGERHPTH